MFKRAGNERVQQLRVLTGHQGYKIDEVAYEDEWVKRGGSHYMGKLYSQGTELLTMGIERLIKSPSEFYQKDPEYFEFVVRCLNNIHETTP